MVKLIAKLSRSVIYIWFLFFIGFVLGVLFIACGKGSIFFDEHIFSPEFLFRLQNTDIDKRAVFFLSLGKRLRAFFLLLFLSFSTVHLLFASLFFLLAGMYTGGMMELLAVGYGIKGLLLYFELVFPQGIFYAAGFSILGHWSVTNLGKKEITSYSGDEGMTPYKKIAVALVLVLIGIVLESYV